MNAPKQFPMQNWIPLLSGLSEMKSAKKPWSYYVLSEKNRLVFGFFVTLVTVLLAQDFTD